MSNYSKQDQKQIDSEFRYYLKRTRKTIKNLLQSASKYSNDTYLEKIGATDFDVCKQFAKHSGEHAEGLKKMLDESTKSNDKLQCILDDLQVRIDKIMNTYETYTNSDTLDDLASYLESQDELSQIMPIEDEESKKKKKKKKHVEESPESSESEE